MIPQSIGNYQILGELGRGAMGVVYHARDPGIGRPVAIKVIRVDGATSTDEGAQLRHRLMREASAAGNLSHPGIVTVHQLGEEGHDVFVVMEYVQGPSLEQILAGEPHLDPRRALEILRQVAEALDYAHSSGIVHRDIKPANILVRVDGCAKVADFGIAKVMQATTQAMTAVGTSLGSPSYMSPEQVRGESVDGRSDQFALAVVAFQMLAGRRPFIGDTAHAVMYQIVGVDPFQREPVPLPPQAVAALAKALAKNPNDRFPSCSAFIYELRQALGVETAASGAITMPSRVRTQTLPVPGAPALPGSMPAPAPTRKSPVLIGVLLGLLVCLAAASLWLLGSKGLRPANPNKSGGTQPAASPQTESALIKAIAEGRLDDARDQIAKGADVNAPNPDGTTALMQAAEGSGYLPHNAPAVAMLLDKNASVDAQDKRGRTALYRAVAEGKSEAVQLLLAHKANPNQKAADGSTPLSTAVTFGHLPVLRLLLDGGADVDLADSQGNTPLMLASEGTGYMPNNAPLVEALLAKNAKVDSQDSRGRTPLYRAAEEGKTDAARLLLDKKADPNHQAHDGATPLFKAVTFGHSPMVQLLLEHGAEVDRADASGNTPLMVAAEGSGYLPHNAPMVATLLAANAKVDAQDARGRSPLHRAATEGKDEAIGLLLDKKANPNLKASDGSTPLIEAVKYGKEGAVALLLTRGADANLADAAGNTPLMIAAEGSGYIKTPADLIALLLAHGAKTELMDAQGRTALGRATATKNVPAIEALKKK